MIANIRKYGENPMRHLEENWNYIQVSGSESAAHKGNVR